MKYLVPGGESVQRIDLLLKFTSIRSLSKIGALKAYYCDGADETTACWLFDLDVNNFRKTCDVLEKVTETHELLKQLGYKGLLN